VVLPVTPGAENGSKTAATLTRGAETRQATGPGRPAPSASQCPLQLSAVVRPSEVSARPSSAASPPMGMIITLLGMPYVTELTIVGTLQPMKLRSQALAGFQENEMTFPSASTFVPRSCMVASIVPFLSGQIEVVPVPVPGTALNELSNSSA